MAPLPGETTEEFLQRIRENIRKSNALVEEAREKMAETEQLYRQSGLSPEEVERILNDPQLPPEVRRVIDDINRQWEEELSEISQRHYQPQDELEYRTQRLNALKNPIRL